MKKLLFALALFVFSLSSYAQSSLDSLRMVLPIGHSDNVLDLKLSKDGSKVLTRSYDNSCIVYDLKKKKEIISYHGSGTYILDANFSNNSDLLFICSDSTTSVFNLISNEPVSILSGHHNFVQSGMFNSNDEQILTSSKDGIAQIFDVKSGKSVIKFIGHRAGLNSATYNKSEDLIVTGGKDSLIIVWNVKFAKSIIEIKAQGEVTYAEFSSNDKFLLASAKDSICHFLNLENNEIFKLPGYPNHGGDSFGLKKSFDISQNSEFIVTYKGRTFYLWKIVNGIPQLSVKKNENSEINSARFDFSGSFILTANSDGSAAIYSVKNGVELNKITGHKSAVNCALFAPSLIQNDSISRFIITCSDDKSVKLNDIFSGQSSLLTDNLQTRVKYLSSLNDSILAVVLQNSKYLKIFDIKNISINQDIRAHDKSINFIDAFSKKKMFLTIGNDSKVKIWRKSNLEEFRTFEVKNQKILFAEISDDSSKVFTYSTDSIIRIWNCFTNQCDKIFKPPSGKCLENYDINWKSNILVFSCSLDDDLKSNKDVFFVFSIESGDLISKVTTKFDIGKMLFSSFGAYIAVTTIDSCIYLFDSLGKEKLVLVGHSDEIEDINFFENDEYLYSTSYDGSTIIWDLKTGNKVFKLKGHSEMIVKSIISSDEKFLATSSFDNTTRVWDLERGDSSSVFNSPKGWFKHLFFVGNSNLLITSSENESAKLLDVVTGKIILEFIFLKGNNWFVRLGSSPYYMCSKEASKMLHYVTPSLKVIGFDQLDPVYNRPDIVLDSIGKYFGSADKDLVANYHAVWEKRIDRLGLVKDKLTSGEIAVPNAEIINAEQIRFANENGKVVIHVEANDPKYALRRYNILVNEVPVYGSEGISIAELNTKQFERTDTLALSLGNNKIQISVMNELGLENFKYPTYVNFSPKETVSSKTYYVGIGVNHFKDASHDLKYCVKDVQDLAKAFKSDQTQTDTILFTDQEVTKENILALKSYLQNNTTVNDKVIISCSSHGLLDDSLNFYLATHDVDFSNPKERGLKYEELESLLDGIPARQKLLLLDACNSGENERLLVEMNKSNDIAKNDSKRGEELEIASKEVDTFQKMNELFVNVRNNTGSVIISAAGGLQSALEAIEVDGKEIKNGAFTFTVLEYLNQSKESEIKVNDLKLYVEKRVEEITKGKQKPTSRQETMEVDWVVK